MSDNQQPTRTACCACVRNGVEGWRASSCSRSATVERDGKPYYSQHDPEAMAARRQAKNAEWDAEYERKKAAYRLQSAAPDLLAALKGILHIADRKAAEFDAAHAAIAKAEGAESHAPKPKTGIPAADMSDEEWEAFIRRRGPHGSQPRPA